MPFDDELDELETTNPLIGTMFLDQYRILEVKGTGGMSTVYKARHEVDGHSVAIKVLHSHVMQNNASMKRMQKEAKALTVLQHDNIVRSIDLGATQEGQPYLIMDFVEGVSLQQLLDENGAMPQERAVKVFLQVCGAIEFAHSQGVLHRDIKPSNIMISQEPNGDYKAMVVDFGLAKLSAEHTQQMTLTATGEILGSPPYMSPEQCRGDELDARTDVYSLGCLMYETLTGVPPFRAETWAAFMYKHLNEEPLPFKLRRQECQVSRYLESVVLTALEKAPERRQQSVGALRVQLERWLNRRNSSFDILAPFLSPRRTAHKWYTMAGRTSRLVAAGVFAGIFCCLLAFAAIVSFDIPDSMPIMFRRSCWDFFNRCTYTFIDMRYQGGAEFMLEREKKIAKGLDPERQYATKLAEEKLAGFFTNSQSNPNLPAQPQTVDSNPLPQTEGVVHSDRQLNDVYNNLMASIDKQSELHSLIKKSENAWIRYRDAQAQSAVTSLGLTYMDSQFQSPRELEKLERQRTEQLRRVRELAGSLKAQFDASKSAEIQESMEASFQNLMSVSNDDQKIVFDNGQQLWLKFRDAEANVLAAFASSEPQAGNGDGVAQLSAEDARQAAVDHLNKARLTDLAAMYRSLAGHGNKAELK